MTRELGALWAKRAPGLVVKTPQEALILAKPGDTVELAAGKYEFTGGVSLDVDRVTLKGALRPNPRRVSSAGLPAGPPPVHSPRSVPARRRRG